MNKSEKLKELRELIVECSKAIIGTSIIMIVSITPVLAVTAFTIGTLMLTVRLTMPPPICRECERSLFRVPLPAEPSKPLKYEETNKDNTPADNKFQGVCNPVHNCLLAALFDQSTSFTETFERMRFCRVKVLGEFVKPQRVTDFVQIFVAFSPASVG